jgi:CubicO group peptidase (beta-lactamase class C family)
MSINRKLLLFLFCFTIGIDSFSQQQTQLDPINNLTDSIAAIGRQEHIVGLMLGITTKDSTLFSGGFGYADLIAGRKVDAGTLFRMGSITKLFVSLGIQKLVRENNRPVLRKISHRKYPDPARDGPLRLQSKEQTPGN